MWNSFLLKLRSSNVFPAFFFWSFAEVLGQHLKSLFWKIMSQHIIQPIKITTRFCKLPSLAFFVFFCVLYKSNHKDTTHPYGRRLGTTLYIDQNVSKACQPGFLESEDFFVQKTGRFRLNRDILKLQKKIGLEAISLLFRSVSSLIEIFLGDSDLLRA